MKIRLITMLCMVVLLSTGINAEEGNTAMLDTRQLISLQAVERSRALQGLTAKYQEVSDALLKILKEASTQFGADCRYHSPLHSAILAVDAWQVIDADALLLSMVDYSLDPSSLPLGMDVPGDFFYPAARALVRLRVDVTKVEQALASVESQTALRILTWVLLERWKDITMAKMALTKASGNRHGATEKRNLNEALDLLNNPSELLPRPSRK